MTIAGPITAEIRGVSTSEVGNPLPATIWVIVKSSVWGNMPLTGTRIGTTSDYTFTYTPPTLATAGFDACSTTVVAYGMNGLLANNDYLDDGLKNGSVMAASGFRFVDATGAPISCSAVGVQPQAWDSVKQLYR